MKNWVKSFVLLSQLCATSSLEAVIRHEIDTYTPLDCSLPFQQASRIMIEGGEIKKLVAPENLFQVTAEEYSGQVFLYPIKSFSGSQLISLVTGEGVVQDILVSLEDKPAELIIFNQKKEEELKLDSSYASKSLINRVITDLHQGRVPTGFVVRDLKGFKKRQAKQNLQLKPRLLLRGPYERVVAYRVRNTSKESIELNEKDFAFDSDLWIYLEKRSLRPHESSEIIIAESLS